MGDVKFIPGGFEKHIQKNRRAEPRQGPAEYGDDSTGP